eukprot:462595_1
MWCRSGYKSDYDGVDPGNKVSPQELRCGVESDTNHNGKIDPSEIAVFEKCLGIRGYDRNGDGKVSPQELACGKIVDKNGNGIIDKNEKKAFIACLTGAKGDYDGNDADKTVNEAELRCGVEADTNQNGKIDPS